MRVPTTMRAAFVRSLGSADLIEVGELPVPRPGPTDVLVRMEASETNYVDLFVRSGQYRTRTPFPFVIGRDLVGTVVEAGPGAGFRVGDRVWTNSLGHAGRQGAFAEYAVVAGERLYRLPAGVEPRTAAPVLHTAATAALGLFRRARVRAGDTVFVGGAGGGVGTAVVQLAVGAGARVVATASPRDAEWCRSCGAGVVVDYHAADALGQIREACPEGVDIWWDTSGHHDFEASLPLVRQGGSVVVMAGMGATPVLPVGALYTRDLHLHGFAISNASVEDLSDTARLINRFLSAGRLPARVAEILPLADAARAHRMLEGGQVRGRILIRP